MATILDPVNPDLTLSNDHSLYVRKSNGLFEKKTDTLEKFKFAMCGNPWPDEETKEPATRDWPGLDGEDVYIPSDGLRLKAFDVTIDFCYKGPVSLYLEDAQGNVTSYGSAYKAFEAFKDYLTGHDGMGAHLDIYDPMSQRGYAGVYLKKIGNIKRHQNAMATDRMSRLGVFEVLFFQATFRVTDPTKKITLA